MRIIYQKPEARVPAVPVPALICGAGGLFVMMYSGSWLAAMLLVVYGIFFSACTRRVLADPFETDVLYLLYFGFYCILPVVLAACKPDRFDQRLLDPTLIFFTMLTMLAVFAGMHSPLFKRLSSTDLGIDHEWDAKEARSAAIVLMVVGTVLLALLIQSVGLSTYLNSRYVELYNAEKGKGYLVAGIFLIEIGILVLALSTAQYRKHLNKFAFVIGIIVSLCYLRIGRRGVVLSIAMGLLIVTHFYWRPLKWRVVVALVLAGFMSFALIGQVRAFSEEGWEGMVVAAREDVSFEDVWGAFAEANAVQVAFREVIQYIPEQSPYRMGMSYLEGFETLIPEKLHPNRPLTSSQWFAYLYDPQTAAQGGGFSFSIFAEGYLNFGLVGVLMVGVLEGALIRRFVEIRWASPANKSRLLIVAAVATQMPYSIRGEFASILKQNFVIVLLPAILVAAYLGRNKQPQQKRLRVAGVGR